MAKSKRIIMIPLKQEELQSLTKKVLDLLAKTAVEIGHRSDAQTLASLSKIFAADLIQEKRFGNMTWNQILDAFHIGVRFGKDEPFLNIRTFYKFVYAHKKVIDDATYQTETLKQKNVRYYQPQIKLLK
tara:strand:+ start:198 stop:584 length:387 start_codon:yes stop_codon:yes gene_type:complete